MKLVDWWRKSESWKRLLVLLVTAGLIVIAILGSWYVTTDMDVTFYVSCGSSHADANWTLRVDGEVVIDGEAGTCGALNPPPETTKRLVKGAHTVVFYLNDSKQIDDTFDVWWRTFVVVVVLRDESVLDVGTVQPTWA